MNEQLVSHYKPPKPVPYALLTLGIHLGISLLMRYFFGSAYSTNLSVRHGVVPVITYAVPLFVICRYYVPLVVPAQYREGGKWTWVRSFLRLVLPGETVRMLLSIVNLGALSLGNFFSPCSWLMTEKLYLYPRLEKAASAEAAARVVGSAGVMYIFCYLLYLLLTYLPVLLICYRVYWNRGQKQYEHLKAVYAEHEADAQARDAMPDAEAKVIPEHKAKAFAAYNSFHGKRPKK